LSEDAEWIWDEDRTFDAVVKVIALAAILVVVGGCASSEKTEPRPAKSLTNGASATTVIAVSRSPEWITEYCAEAARTIKPPVLCPGRVPSGITPTENLEILRPSPEGYVFEGEAEAHWVFAASQGDVEGDYGAMRPLTAARVRGRSGRWLYAPETGGIHAHHLVLTWREGRLHYVISAHTDDPDSEELRPQLLAVAERMRLYR
jgi:hypothetical protein